jgi:hypothetical protein
LSDQYIEAAISRSSNSLRAVTIDDQTRFLCIGIPNESPWHEPERLAGLIACLKKAGISNTHLYKASGSDDWQLFVFWSTWVDSKDVSKAIRWWLTIHSFDALDQLLIHSEGDLLPLPLQSEFAWLNTDGQVALRREDISLDQALESFGKDVASANYWEEVASTMQAALSNQHIQAAPEDISVAQSNDEVYEASMPDVPAADTNMISSPDPGPAGITDDGDAKTMPDTGKILNFDPTETEVSTDEGIQLSLFSQLGERAPP